MRQMRTFMQEMLLPVQLLSDDLSRAGGDPSGRDAAFQKDLLPDAPAAVQSGLSALFWARPRRFFQPITMDLVGPCAAASATRPPLCWRGAGVTLTFRCSGSSLLIPGDPELLSKLILTLLSNAAKAAPKGSVFLTVAQRRDRAILSVTDSGQDFAQEDLDASSPLPCPTTTSPLPRRGRAWG